MALLLGSAFDCALVRMPALRLRDGPSFEGVREQGFIRSFPQRKI